MRNKKHTLFYLPGLISLVCLPMFCVPYLFTASKKPRAHVIEVNWWHPDLDTPKELHLPFDKYPNRAYRSSRLTPNKKYNAIILNQFQQDVRQLIIAKDTLSGIHLQLTNNSTFADFIQILNILMKEKSKTYFVFDNDVWVYNYFPDTTKKTSPSRLPICGGTGFIPQEDIDMELTANEYLSFDLFPLAFLYLLMVLLTFLKLKRHLPKGNV